MIPKEIAASSATSSCSYVVPDDLPHVMQDVQHEHTVPVLLMVSGASDATCHVSERTCFGAIIPQTLCLVTKVVGVASVIISLYGMRSSTHTPQSRANHALYQLVGMN